MRTRKMLALLLAGAMTAGMAAGCSSGNSENTGGRQMQEVGPGLRQPGRPRVALRKEVQGETVRWLKSHFPLCG